MKWILASASPRRRELLAEVIQEFEIIPATGEECVEGNPTPEGLVRQLAEQKAAELASRYPDRAVLGADTVVAFDGKVLGKPKDEADAKRMLELLSGNTHEVYTGVCICYPAPGGERVILVDAACTKVVFEELDKDMVAAYVATGSPMDKAGAYGIQDGGLVKEIQGSYSNVVGLPLELVREMLKEIEGRR